MKASIITRIVLYSVLILVLCGVLVAGISGNSFGFGISTGYNYDNAAMYTEGGGSIDSAQINEIEVSWIGGDINIIELSGADIISFSEEGGSSPMQYLVKGDKLLIKFCKPRRLFNNTESKNLTLEIPTGKALNRLSIENVNGNIKSYVYADIDNIAVESVNGDIDLQGNFKAINCETVSGDVRFFTGKTLREGDFETVSSDVTVEFVQNSGANDIKGFTAELDSVSGRINSDFETTFHDDTLIYGTPTCELDFETVSGDVYIKKANQR